MAKEALAAGKSAEEAASDYAIPARYVGYSRSDPERIQTNIQTIYDELGQ